jgi:hypothetical protein
LRQPARGGIHLSESLGGRVHGRSGDCRPEGLHLAPVAVFGQERLVSVLETG